VRFLTYAFVIALLALSAGTLVWLNRPMGPAVDSDLVIEPGTSPHEVALEAVHAGADTHASWLYWMFRLSGQSRQIKAGNYVLSSSSTPLQLLRSLTHGDENLASFTLVEGWNFSQVRDALKKAEGLHLVAAGMDAQHIMQQLGRPGVALEGRLFPDTYSYARGSSDLALLQRAAHAMDRRLAEAWAQRDAQTPLQNADQALILASIVEKETGKSADRPLIAAVFSNRLRLGMRLQTDPTVIYGMGAAYAGVLHKSDLLADTPWNTYTREGLPPTPIAMPGKAALLAAVHPAVSDALYFVARGDGSSQFSATLAEHNRAVDKFQRGQP